MSKKGFIHFLPLIIIAVVVVGGFSFLSIVSEQKQKEAVGKVLHSSDEDNSGRSGSGKSDSDDLEDEGKSSSSGPGSSGTTKVESRTPTDVTKIETSDDKTKIEVRNEEGRFETEIKEGEERTKIRIGSLRMEFKQEGGQVIVKVRNENDEEVELEDGEKNELLGEVDEELEEKGIRLATGSAGLGFVQNGRRVRTNFPLSVNPETGELFVTTPAGEKVVAILPNVAIQNMIKAGILTRVSEEPSPSPSPGEGTGAALPSEGTEAATVEGAAIELTEVNGEPVYLISGVRDENFLGLIPVGIRLKAVVSVTDGQLIDVRLGLFSRLLDLLAL